MHYNFPHSCKTGLTSKSRPAHGLAGLACRYGPAYSTIILDFELRCQHCFSFNAVLVLESKIKNPFSIPKNIFPKRYFFGTYTAQGPCQQF